MAIHTGVSCRACGNKHTILLIAQSAWRLYHCLKCGEGTLVA